MNYKKPVILAISAASGIIFGLKTLECLLQAGLYVELIISRNAYYIANQEIGLQLTHDSQAIKQAVTKYLNLNEQADNLKVWLNDELWASPASGSYQTAGMIISPASMSTVAQIASGIAESLITRVADVHLKEGRKLAIVPRETPFSSIHLENMLTLSRCGARIVPPIAGFYGKMDTLDDYIAFTAGKTLDAINVENQVYKRWQHE